ncbi:unnamed protein product [Nezara viridula]|uniref:Uncharacterized protein n=1 Tax=Nezara viridula TaxID=85310 RepID=A0A9P0HEW1_NEZVI|nr:unnamed protein product [Nezara viridula]
MRHHEVTERVQRGQHPMTRHEVLANLKNTQTSYIYIDICFEKYVNKEVETCWNDDDERSKAILGQSEGWQKQQAPVGTDQSIHISLSATSCRRAWHIPLPRGPGVVESWGMELLLAAFPVIGETPPDR